MKTPPPKDKVFASRPDSKEEEDYYLRNYPCAPEKNELFYYRAGVYFLSEEGFLHFLPFFVECLSETPYPYDTLSDAIRTKIEGLGPETKAEYKGLIQEALARIEKIDAGEVEFSATPTKHEFRPED